MIVRVNKEFDFEMAHALDYHDGKCKNLHGHTYKLIVTIKGAVIKEPKNPKDGMILDFGDLKTIVKEHIVDRFDHALTLSSQSPFLKAIEAVSHQKLEVVNFQPTAENLVALFAEILQKELPNNVELYSLKLYETQTSSAEWFAIDNQ